MINSKVIKDLKKITKYVHTNEDMKYHTTFHIGGKSTLVDIKDLSTLIKVVDYLNDKHIEYMVIGNGSNILVDDLGYDGVILKLCDAFCNVEYYDDIVHAYAGISFMKFILLMREHNLGGLENLSGIPGTVGGGVYMNCGAFGTEIADHIIGVLYMLDGKFDYKERSELDFSYRHSWFMESNAIIVRVDFRLNKCDSNEILGNIVKKLEYRKTTQPIGDYSAGSVFKRVDGEPISKNLDLWELKGYTIGQAKVSEKHAGFIINMGNASSQNVLDLIQYIKKYYFDKTGVMLEEEVRYIRRKE